ncbi:uncharacterized isomerase BH0283-like isoform X2 [Zingiber officinale]|uniref:Phenazine biosynthesis PhzC/PhzF protein n=1 Tax=Zingiber officinale TaxID=94328 RepID=A0A8J5HP78_ZINOF|nr:uncharacterized isomerase BH0283-like isoform X2 [Zingiber officinale]KAG6528375.1 hypothetical protein ZIOFF_010530 [Zingiber officinale]
MEKRAVRYAVIDAFTGRPFKGNPAAVCLLDAPEDAAAGDDWMQSVAKEFNAPVTAFLSRAVDVGSDGPTNGVAGPRFNIRWFTSVLEVNICGHATLAAAHFLWSLDLVNGGVIYFSTKSGLLKARKAISLNNSDTTNISLAKSDKFFIELDFPLFPVAECDTSEKPLIPDTLNGASVINVLKFGADEDLIVELSSTKEILNLQPNFEEIQKCARGSLAVTAPAPAGSEFDFFTHYFCPKFGVYEDHVCGSVHCALAPYWSKKLGKNNLVAYMASPRSGRLDLELIAEARRICIRGEAVTVMTGTLLV